MMNSEKRIGQDLILGTQQERIRLLKTGFTGKEIEMLYIKNNNFKIVLFTILIENVDFDMPENEDTCMALEAEFVQA